LCGVGLYFPSTRIGVRGHGQGTAARGRHGRPDGGTCAAASASPQAQAACQGRHPRRRQRWHTARGISPSPWHIYTCAERGRATDTQASRRLLARLPLVPHGSLCCCWVCYAEKWVGQAGAVLATPSDSDQGDDDDEEPVAAPYVDPHVSLSLLPARLTHHAYVCVCIYIGRAASARCRRRPRWTRRSGPRSRVSIPRPLPCSYWAPNMYFPSPPPAHLTCTCLSVQASCFRPAVVARHPSTALPSAQAQSGTGAHVGVRVKPLPPAPPLLLLRMRPSGKATMRATPGGKMPTATTPLAAWLAPRRAMRPA
jgi:hypothetical protein